MIETFSIIQFGKLNILIVIDLVTNSNVNVTSTDVPFTNLLFVIQSDFNFFKIFFC